jgi:hypothetical protein
MVEISNELKLGVGHVRRVQDWRMRNAVPPPITDAVLEEETGRGLLMRVKPGGVASSSSAYPYSRTYCHSDEGHVSGKYPTLEKNIYYNVDNEFKYISEEVTAFQAD